MLPPSLATKEGELETRSIHDYDEMRWNEDIGNGNWKLSCEEIGGTYLLFRHPEELGFSREGRGRPSIAFCRTYSVLSLHL